MKSQDLSVVHQYSFSVQMSTEVLKEEEDLNSIVATAELAGAAKKWHI